MGYLPTKRGFGLVCWNVAVPCSKQRICDRVARERCLGSSHSSKLLISSDVMLRFRKCSPGCGAAFEKLVLFPLQLGGAQAEVVEPVAQCDRRRLGGNGTNEAGEVYTLLFPERGQPVLTRLILRNSWFISFGSHGVASTRPSRGRLYPSATRFPSQA